MELRNAHPAFDVEGECEVTVGEGGALKIRRTSADGSAWAQLDARLAEHSFTLTHS